MFACFEFVKFVFSKFGLYSAPHTEIMVDRTKRFVVSLEENLQELKRLE